MTDGIRPGPAEAATSTLPWPGSGEDPWEPSGTAALAATALAGTALADTLLDLIPVLGVPAGDAGRAARGREASALRDTQPQGIPAILDIPFPGPGTAVVPVPLIPPAGGGATGRRQRGRRRRATPWQPAIGGYAAGFVLATVVPLCLLQVPYAALQFAAAAAASPAGLVLRAASLALPFAVAAAPLGALAAVRMRPWPVLLAGVLVIMAGDGLTGLAGGTPATSGALA
ncbi:hypothetical protein, partial [Trebonia sp.]|uniref:hypothetical protein n=1 Tax=Trebonia sp. TaxID=2767075 RepID=UPI0026345B31